MNTLKLLNHEINLTKKELSQLRKLEEDLRKNEKDLITKETIVHELEAIGEEALKYITMAKEHSERIRNGKANLKEIQEVFNIVNRIYYRIDRIGRAYTLMIGESNVSNNRILKDLAKLKDDLHENSKEIRELIARERISHYIQ
ncbi:MAG: hypothetical protein JSW73_05480 [Candidatus Woesearchaeota archaeon]|nr:MAG: hypothetical protein JSW73_05480 [Candidatus Woesearchaeota archaeon]